MNSFSNHTDTELFALIAKGDETAFRQVFHQYNKRLFPFVLSLVKSSADAKEVMQDVFIKLWLHREKLEEVENPGGWLHTITTNATYDFLRNQARYELRLSEFQNLQASQSQLEIVHQNTETTATQDLVQAAIKELPLRRRKVFQLIKLEGYSRKEVAELLDISENTVRNQLSEAMSFVEDYLTRNHIVLSVPLSILLVTLM